MARGEMGVCAAIQRDEGVLVHQIADRLDHHLRPHLRALGPLDVSDQPARLPHPPLRVLESGLILPIHRVVR